MRNNDNIRHVSRTELKGLRDTLATYHDAWNEGAISDVELNEHLKYGTEEFDRILVELDDVVVDKEDGE